MQFPNTPNIFGFGCDLRRRTSNTSTTWTTCSSPSIVSETMYSPPSMSMPPKIIVLGLWPYATHEQIQYYVQGYEALYPTARVLLLRHSTAYDGHITHALDAITLMNEQQAFSPALDVLLHLFGAGGAAQGCRLLRSYKVRTGQTLGVKAVVLDSAPRINIPSWGSMIRVPARLPTFAYAVAVAFYIFLLQSLTLWESRSRQNCRDLNDDFLIPAKAKKCYIFTERDLMFTWKGCSGALDDQADDDDDENSDPHERRDYAVKRSSIDECEKWTSDQERYWLGIEDVWDGR